MRSLKIQKPVGGEFPGSIWIFIFSVEKAKKLEFSVSGGKHNWVSEIWECKEALRRGLLGAEQREAASGGEEIHLPSGRGMG